MANRAPARFSNMRVFPSDRLGKAFRPRKRRGKKKNGRKPSTTHKSIGYRLLRSLLLGLVIVLLACWLMVLPLRWIDPPTTAFMLQDNSGRIPVMYTWQPWETIGTAAPLAMVAAEDQKFAHHFGFDVKSIRDSVEDFKDGEPLRGASTISQQVAKNLYLWPGKNLMRKGVEAYFTALLEVCLSKKRILEIYLNIAELGPGIYGINAASKTYFGKAAAELSLAEAALIAAVLPNPNVMRVDQPSDYVRKRQRWIIGQMQRLQREGWLTLLD